MHALMGTSPIASRAAVAHSQTPLNLSVLDGKVGLFAFKFYWS